MCNVVHAFNVFNDQSNLFIYAGIRKITSRWCGGCEKYVFSLNFTYTVWRRSKEEWILDSITKLGLEINIKLIKEDILSRIRVGLRLNLN